MGDEKVDLSVEAQRLKTALRRADLQRYVALIRLAHDGYPEKQGCALLKRLQPADAGLDAKVEAALDGIAFKFEDPNERLNRQA